MCAAALATAKIGRVIFGCRNDRFGGCGSILHLHKSEIDVNNGNGDEKIKDDNSDAGHKNNTNIRSSWNRSMFKGYPIETGVLEKEAIWLLQSFYNRENFYAPDHKRRKKDVLPEASSDHQ